VGKGTNIEWCDDTLSVSSGCGEGCELWIKGKGGPCYAGHIHETRLAKTLPELYAPTFDEVRLIPGRMAKAMTWSDLRGKDRPDKPWLNGMPRLIFVNDLGDLFSEAVPFDYIRDEVIQMARSSKGSRHVLMLLTKQPQVAYDFDQWLIGQGIAWPENVWIGTSVTRKATVKRIDWIRKIRAAVRFVSVEPMLEQIDLTRELGGIHQVIIGGESKQGGFDVRSCAVEWIWDLIVQCCENDTKCFVKQFGSAPTARYYSKDEEIREWARACCRRVLIDRGGGRFFEHFTMDGQPPPDAMIGVGLRDSHGGNWDEWPEHFRVRQLPPVATADLPIFAGKGAEN
jgi:protein gp37